MKIVVIDQARMTSTRLPGKVMKEVIEKPLLEYQIERLRKLTEANQLVIATTTNDTDIPIVELCNRMGVEYYKGSEEDVLSRYYEAATKFEADIVVRVTSDCPLIDPAIVDRVIKYYKDEGNYDYVSNTLIRTYPRGMDTEVFSFKVLEEVYLNAQEISEREHVTPFIYKNPGHYKLGNVRNNEDKSEHRWTVDTTEDFELISMIIEQLYFSNPSFGLSDILELLHDNPQWKKINDSIEQKII